MLVRSLRTQVCLQYDAKQVAVAALFLAFEELKLPQLLVGGREWWSVPDALHPAVTCEQMLGARTCLQTPKAAGVPLHRRHWVAELCFGGASNGRQA